MYGNTGECWVMIKELPDAILEECFVKWDVYKQYYQLETIILNANGTLGE